MMRDINDSKGPCLAYLSHKTAPASIATQQPIATKHTFKALIFPNHPKPHPQNRAHNTIDSDKYTVMDILPEDRSQRRMLGHFRRSKTNVPT